MWPRWRPSFRRVAQAIFAAQPLETVALGGVSFVEAFGRPLVKEDLIFSAVEDPQGRLWVGTLGGGLRRIEVRDGVPQDTLHLTRQEGLGSNLILALAVGPDGAVWAATDEGVSRLRERDGAVEISNFCGAGTRARAGAEGGGGCGGDGLAGHGCGPVPAAARGRQRGGGHGPRGVRAAAASGWRATTRAPCRARSCPPRWWYAWKISSARPWWARPSAPRCSRATRSSSPPPATVTDAQGEARFRLAVAQSEADLVVEVAAPALPQVAPVQFLAIIGEVDTPGVPVDLAVAGDVVFVAANQGSLQVIDVRDPTQPGAGAPRYPPALSGRPDVGPGAGAAGPRGPMWPRTRPGCTSSI